jgi:hypothetical protein
MGYRVINVSQETREKYVSRDNLEGPFFYDGNRALYYDTKEGKYLNPTTDMYMSHDEYFQFTKD